MSQVDHPDYYGGAEDPYEATQYCTGCGARSYLRGDYNHEVKRCCPDANPVDAPAYIDYLERWQADASGVLIASLRIVDSKGWWERDTEMDQLWTAVDEYRKRRAAV